MTATGAYLRVLREERNLSREDVAVSAGTSAVQVFRVEKGEIDTRGSMLMALVRAVRGSVEHVAQLLLDEGATAEDGERLAHQWLSRTHIEMLDAIPDDEVEEAITIIRELRRQRADQVPVAVRLLRALTGR